MSNQTRVAYRGLHTVFKMQFCQVMEDIDRKFQTV